LFIYRHTQPDFHRSNQSWKACFLRKTN